MKKEGRFANRSIEQQIARLLLTILPVMGGIIVLLIFGIYGPGFNPAEFVYMQF